MSRLSCRFAVMLACVFATPAFAQNEAPAVAATPQATPAEGSAISIELNKLEPAQNACRGYFVVDNRSPKPLKELQIDDSVVQPRMALSDIKCDDIGRLLVNDVLACTDADGAAIEGCADIVGVTTRTAAKFDY